MTPAPNPAHSTSYAPPPQSETSGLPAGAPTSSTSGAACAPAMSIPASLAATLFTPTSETAGPAEPPPPTPPMLLPRNLDSPTETELLFAVAGRKSFSTQTPGLQLVWDATSLSAFLACPTRYYYNIVLGLQPLTKSVHLTFGGAYQSALELYDRERLRGASHRDATISAVAYGYKKGAELPLEKRPTDLAVTEPTPPAEVKRRDMLVKAVVDHCETFADDPLRTVELADGTPAVEFSFRFDAGFEMWNINGMGEPVEFSGHFDRVVTHGGDPDSPWYILDHKTSKRAVDEGYKQKFELSTQMQHYDFAGSVVLPKAPVGVIIDSVQMLADAVRTTRFPIRFTPARRTEYYEDIRTMLPDVGLYVSRSRFPRNRESCLLCDFKRLCRVDPSIRGHIAATEFTRRLWDPAEPRLEEVAP